MSLFKTQTQKSLSLLHSMFIRTLTSSSPQLRTKKPLSLLFEESVGLSQKTHSDDETESNDVELQSKLKELETEVRELRAKTQKPKSVNVSVKENVKRKEAKQVNSLSALFLDKKERRVREEKPRVFKELSPEMKLLVSHLHSQGYFSKANFLPGQGDKRELDFSCFNDDYSRSFIKFAAEKFGKDHQEIAKWLSGSDLKKVVSFGCPSLAKKNTFAAKRLRGFFEIPEDTVCAKCMLKDKCNFVNHSVWKRPKDNLNLAVVMRVITLYALDSVPPELTLPDDLKASVHKLLKEVIDLSKTTQKAVLS